METKGKSLPEIDRRLCKACGVCVEICPKRVLSRDAEGKPVIGAGENCIRCGLCELQCPDFAIRLYEEG